MPAIHWTRGKCRYNGGHEEAMGLQAEEHQRLVGGVYEGRKRKAKAFPNKSLAQHFRHIKYMQLNDDVFTSTIDIDSHTMLEEYGISKRVEGLRGKSI